VRTAEAALRSARTILFFAPLPRRDGPLAVAGGIGVGGKNVALPWFDPATQTYLARRVENPACEIVAGKFGVREPAPGCVEIPLQKIDLVLVPASRLI